MNWQHFCTETTNSTLCTKNAKCIILSKCELTLATLGSKARTSENDTYRLTVRKKSTKSQNEEKPVSCEKSQRMGTLAFLRLALLSWLFFVPRDDMRPW